LSTWKRGRRLVSSRLAADAMPLDIFTSSVADVPKVPGTAVFLTGNPEGVPHALLHSLKHYKCLHEHIAILHVEVLEEPHVTEEGRMNMQRINDQFFTIHMRYGFMDEIDVPAALMQCRKGGLALDEMSTSYFLGRETLIPKVKSEMSFW